MPPVSRRSSWDDRNMTVIPTSGGEAEAERSAKPGGPDVDVHETHTGMVVLVGDRAYKVKKPVVTDFLDFSTAERRERACRHEVSLNSRLAPDSYLGLGHFTGPEGGPPEPVIVMRRYPDARRLATMVKNGVPVHAHLEVIADTLARFHVGAARGSAIDACGSVDAVGARWRENLEELSRHTGTVLDRAAVDQTTALAAQFVAGRSELFARRIADGRIVDGHADLLADDIFCLDDGPVILDCLEFDDELRFVDGIDDAAFLAMDLEYLGRRDLGDWFLRCYCEVARDTAPPALLDFYVAYRAVVRAKVDCVRVSQGHRDATTDARRHMDIALAHLHAGTVRLVVVGGGPGTGKTTLSHALAERIRAAVISTDDVRRQLLQAGTITGTPGVLNSGLYAPHQVSAVYDAVLVQAREHLCAGRSVILDGTWRDARQRDRARRLASETSSIIDEFTCELPLDKAADRIRGRGVTTSDATPEIATAVAGCADRWVKAHPIDTGGRVDDAVEEALRICEMSVVSASTATGPRG